MIRGSLVGLRSIEEEDLPQLMEWRNEPTFRQFFREYRELGSYNQRQWFDSVVTSDKSTIMFTIINLANGELLGCCGLCYINWIQRTADLSLYIGGSYIDDHGFAREACKLLFDYGFGEIGLHKIWTEIYDFDAKKYDLYTDLGFSQDGLLRENYFHAGTWHDSRIMSLLTTEWLLGGDHS